MGVGHLVGVNHVHFTVARHNLNTHTREFVQNIQNRRGGLLPVQRGTVEHRVRGEIIQQRTIAGDSRQRQLDVPQRRTDGLRRAACGHCKKSPHAGVQLDDSPVAGRDARLGRQ